MNHDSSSQAELCPNSGSTAVLALVDLLVGRFLVGRAWLKPARHDLSQECLVGFAMARRDFEPGCETFERFATRRMGARMDVYRAAMVKVQPAKRAPTARERAAFIAYYEGPMSEADTAAFARAVGVEPDELNAWDRSIEWRTTLN